MARYVTPSRIQGRFTLYGEFLMHARTWGYVAPVPLYLRSSRAKPSAYDYEADEVGHLLQRMGFSTQHFLNGNLPFGLGFAASTVLAFLHLRDQASDADHEQIVRVLDWIQHGFMPSGADYAAIRAQSPGFFLQGRWRPAPPCPVACVFCSLPPAPKRPPGQTRTIVESIASRLQPLADRLTRTLENTGTVTLGDLHDYCLVLSEAGVYSEPQQLLVDAALSRHIAAKGIGGLYNKAMILIGELQDCLSFAAQHPNLTVLAATSGNASLEAVE